MARLLKTRKSTAAGVLDAIRGVIAAGITVAIAWHVWPSSPVIALLTAIPLLVVMLAGLKVLLSPLYVRLAPEYRLKDQLRQALRDGDQDRLKMLSREYVAKFKPESRNPR